jgi:hypothetical protein
MDDKYMCRRCNYCTLKYTDMKRHYGRKTLCTKNIESMNMSDDQILVYSLLPIANNNSIIKKSEIKHLNKSSKLFNNKKKLFEMINLIDVKKIKKCMFCDECFTKQIDFKKHILIDCFYKNYNNNINNEYKDYEEDDEDDDEHINEHINEHTNEHINEHTNKHTNEHTNKHTNEHTNENIKSILSGNINNINGNNNVINNNVYLQINLKPPIPFDNDWDVSKLTNRDVGYIFSTKYMYTELLKEILQNEINLNVIIDIESKSGLVYKNDIDKYIQMKSSDIVNNTMLKLQNHLQTLNKNNKTQYDEIIDFTRKMINKKYNDYSNDNKTNEAVNILMSDIYLEKKEQSTNVFNNLPIELRENKKNVDFDINGY